ERGRPGATSRSPQEQCPLDLLVGDLTGHPCEGQRGQDGAADEMAHHARWRARGIACAQHRGGSIRTGRRREAGWCPHLPSKQAHIGSTPTRRSITGSYSILTFPPNGVKLRASSSTTCMMSIRSPCTAMCRGFSLSGLRAMHPAPLGSGLFLYRSLIQRHSTRSSSRSYRSASRSSAAKGTYSGTVAGASGI